MCDSTSNLHLSNVISHWWPLSQDPSMQHSGMLNVAGQHWISHRSGLHGHQSSDLRQILLSVCHAPLGLLCTSEGLRMWKKRGRRRSDGVCVCSYMGDWEESLKSCQQLNISLWWGAVWVSVPRGKTYWAHYRWGILPSTRFQCQGVFFVHVRMMWLSIFDLILIQK